MNVLFLSAWYPYRKDLFFGVYVQKHAEALTKYCNVMVVYVHHDEEIDEFEIVTNKKGELNEIIVYYPCKKNFHFYKIRKIKNYLLAYKKGITKLNDYNFEPDIIHANILTRTGLVALVLSIIKRVPFVITEHWTRYLPDSDAFNGIVRKFITKFVVRKAAAVLPVSVMLKKAMFDHKLFNRNYYVIDNVIDPAFLDTYTIQFREKKRIILVSCFFEIAKNVLGIIRAISQLSKLRDDFELIVIGAGVDFDAVYQLSNKLGLTDKFVFFKGEKNSGEVAEWISNSDFMILFPNYETAGIVITESLALGKPVLSTRVGIAEEYIGINEGIIIEVGDEEALTNKMNYMLDNLGKYNSDTIKMKYKNRFSYQTIGFNIVNIYKSILK